ncbi:MAG: D-alanine--D-alanine ligase [Deltaproteobacteria bacterium]|nr:D-alanine--D-alanine ligase [Deltaproteobacteria bacterium]
MPTLAVLFSAVGPTAPDATASAPEGSAPPTPVPVSPQGGVLLSRADNERVAHLVATALRERGHAVHVLGVWAGVPVERLRNVDAVVNLLEGLEGDSSREAEATEALQRAGIPFSGNAADTLGRCQRKEVCRRLLLEAGVPVPAGTVLHAVPMEWPAGVPAPVIVKPAHEDASEGIDARAVARDLAGLQAAVRRVVVEMGQPALVEQFIDGREITASLLGSPPQVLPLGEIDFSTLPAGRPRIVSYAAKWCPESDEYQCTPSVGARLDATVTARIETIARRAAAALKLRDVARLDLRVDARGGAWVIDVNPNCDLAPDAGFAKAAARAGLSYGEMLDRVVARAVAARPDRRAAASA